MLVLAFVVAVVAAVRGMWSPCGLSMLSSLNPVAEASRGNRYPLTACWYVAGAALGGALLGSVCALGAWGFGAVGLGPTAVWTIAALGSLVALASDSVPVRWSLPVHPRQVDVRWLTSYRRWIYAGGFGVQIGSGFATYIMTSAVYLTAALAIVGADPLAAFTIGVAFGVVRGLGILLTASVRTPDALRSVLAGVDAWAARSMSVARLAEAAAATVTAWWAAGPAAAGAVGAVSIVLVCASDLRAPLAVVVRRRVASRS